MVNSHILVFPQQVAWKWKGGGQRQEWRERCRLSCEEENAKEKRKKEVVEAQPSTPTPEKSFSPQYSTISQGVPPCGFSVSDPMFHTALCLSTILVFHCLPLSYKPQEPWFSSSPLLCCWNWSKKSFNKHQDRKEWPRMCLNKVPFLKTVSLK